jgi:hypothetical protein
MKKAKMMLFAIASVAVLSGALAFKAKSVKFGAAVYSTDTPGAVAPLANQVPGFTLVGGGLSTFTGYLTDVAGDNASSVVITAHNMQ